MQVLNEKVQKEILKFAFLVHSFVETTQCFATNIYWHPSTMWQAFAEGWYLPMQTTLFRNLDSFSATWGVFKFQLF